MSILRYITHPNVEIDADTPVPMWGLSALGRRRALAMLDQQWVGSIGRIISSSETKALETADLIAAQLGLSVEVRPESGEIDRSSTGFVEPERHELLADRFFAEPDSSMEGWERAVDAQRRIVGVMRDVVEARDGRDDVAVVGHGAVGTLLMCHLVGLRISRDHDQPGQGHFWSYDRADNRLLHGWRSIDDPEDPPSVG
ncbi:histidine phosphatase family protein [Ilumatobacter nonamiensis]|uniref:histidine phosphatase family protein n=1 Tax=Ilumatobacter nonamiensis TaxID=467093 RepID=UPI00034B529F|nr:histidine phosphatase family protein [Ilumatobacter nonamiensis]